MSTPPVREPRSSVILYALVETAEAATECRVRNLSATGACIDNSAALTAGERVRVTMGTLERLVADVAWATPTLTGLHFEQLVDLGAARRPRGTAATRQTAGWMDGMRNPYRGR